MSINVSSFNIGDVINICDKDYWVLDTHQGSAVEGLIISEFIHDCKSVFRSAVDIDVTPSVATPQQMEFICNRLQKECSDLSKRSFIIYQTYKRWKEATDVDFTLCDTLMERLYTGNIVHLDTETISGYFVVVSSPEDPTESYWSTYHLLSLEHGKIGRDSQAVCYFPDGEDKIQSVNLPGTNVLEYFQAMLETEKAAYQSACHYKLRACAEVAQEMIDFHKTVIDRIQRNHR